MGRFGLCVISNGSNEDHLKKSAKMGAGRSVWLESRPKSIYNAHPPNTLLLF